ncbi:MAG: hypothetical protein ACYTDW_22520 [Planctomycetota bacterium]
MINGETWTSCPGGLFQLAMIKQVSRLSYHCEGRLLPSLWGSVWRNGSSTRPRCER